MKLATVILLVLSLVGGIWLYRYDRNKPTVSGVSSNKYESFVSEVYDKIQQNYWEKINDVELSNLFLLATEKVANKQLILSSQDKLGVNKIIDETVATLSAEKKTAFLASVTDVVMANLKPFGRSRLYSEKDSQSLSNNVNNVNPEANYFDILGVGKSADDTAVKSAFEIKTKEATTAAAKAVVEQAYKVLKNEDSRKVYEVSGVEPTIDYKLLTPSIYYIHMTKFSPTSLDEFVRVAAKVDNKSEELNTLILDLRDNIGGAIDGLPYFLGPFIGPNTYAYQFYQQGNYEDFKTITGWLDSLVRYKKVVVLINENTQSTAEVVAAVLKKYNVGVVMGAHTKGWGTVEKVFSLDNQIDGNQKFSLFLVHHVTLRDDNQPIEGRGVDPMIDISSPNWQKELQTRFGSSEIVKIVERLVEKN